jgi:uncharacterized membrane protein
MIYAGGFIGVALMYIPTQSAQYAVLIIVSFIITIVATVAATHFKVICNTIFNPKVWGKMCPLSLSYKY